MGRRGEGNLNRNYLIKIEKSFKTFQRNFYLSKPNITFIIEQRLYEL